MTTLTSIVRKGICSLVAILFACHLFSQTTMTASITYTPASCPTCCDGSAAISCSGPQVCSPYSVLWSTGSPFFNIVNLCPGVYTATVVSGGPGNCPQQICSTNVTYSIPTAIAPLPAGEKLSVIDHDHAGDEIIYVLYNLEAAGKLEISDINGSVVRAYTLHPSPSYQPIYDSPGNGIYIYRLYSAGIAVKTGRFAICR